MPDSNLSYAGDVTAEAAWDALSARPDATLIDVRTTAEWTYVGVPSLDPLGKSPVLIEWQSFPGMEVARDFTARLAGELERRGVDREAPLLFLCRSGVRSRAAAIAMASAGYRNSFNIAGGFEGARDESNHRGALEGWKAAGLPWVQS